MLLSDVVSRQKVVTNTRRTLTYLCRVLSEVYGGESVVDELCALRGYSDPRMRDLLLTKGIFIMPSLSDLRLVMESKGVTFTSADLRHLGLVGDTGDYWLQDRYILPVREFSGRAIALIAWYPDGRKYITTGTLGFTNVASFFNMESYAKALQPDGTSFLFLVEGVFDALAIESLGYCAFGNQGLALSEVKKEMLQRFESVYFIHDNDRPGRRCNKYLLLSGKHLWDTPNGHLIQLQGYYKDMDDFLKSSCPPDLSGLITSEKHLKVFTG